MMVITLLGQLFVGLAQRGGLLRDGLVAGNRPVMMLILYFTGPDLDVLVCDSTPPFPLCSAGTTDRWMNLRPYIF